MSRTQPDATLTYARWFFLTVIAAASVAIPVGCTYVLVAGNNNSRAALVTGLVVAALLWLVIAVAASRIKTESSRLAWALTIATAAVAVIAPTVPFGGAASIGFGAFVGGFLIGFVVLMARRHQKLR